MNNLHGNVLINYYSIIQKRFLKRPPINTSQLQSGRRVGALAMKVGMLPVWDKWGQRYPCTVLQLDNCHVVQVKTPTTDGYSALQLGVGVRKLSINPRAKLQNYRRKVKATLLGHFCNMLDNGKVNDSVCDKAPVISRKLSEFRVSEDAILPLGTKIEASHFVPGQLVDVCGTSKGKGFQGAMKRWNFKGGSASHGNSLAHRALGATGQCQDPGRVFKNKKMPGRMGGDRKTVQNLFLLKIDTERQLLYVKGAVPGSNGSFVRISDAVKGPFYPSPPPFPTYMESREPLPTEIFAPIPDADTGIMVEPNNPY